MSSHIEWTNARYAHIAGTAIPGVFRNGDAENDVAALMLTSGDGDGLCIEGRPEDLLKYGKRIVAMAEKIIEATDADPALRSLYGRTD